MRKRESIVHVYIDTLILEGCVFAVREAGFGMQEVRCAQDVKCITRHTLVPAIHHAHIMIHVSLRKLGA